MSLEPEEIQNIIQHHEEEKAAQEWKQEIANDDKAVQPVDDPITVSFEGQPVVQPEPPSNRNVLKTIKPE